MISTVIAIVLVAVLVGAVALRPRAQRHEPDTMPAPARLDALAAAWIQRRARRQQPTARAVAAWCDNIARRVRSGSSLRDAVIEAPADPAIERATTHVLLAIDRGQSLANAATRVDSAGAHLHLALGVLATASRIGGPSAASIDRAAMLLRQRAADLEERSTQAAQARLSTHVLTAVPLLMLAVLLVTDADVRTVTTSPTGVTCIGLGFMLNGIGWWWMHRIVRTAT
jgi:tight adherence protein B